MKYIRKLRSMMRNNSLRSRIVLTAFLISAVPLLLIQSVFHTFFFNYVNETAVRIYNTFFTQLSSQISQMVRETTQTSNSIFLNPAFQESIGEYRKDPTLSSRAEVARKLQHIDMPSWINGACFIPIDPEEVPFVPSLNSTVSVPNMRKVLEGQTDGDRFPYSFHIVSQVTGSGQLSNTLLAYRKIMTLSTPFQDLGYGFLELDRLMFQSLLDTNETPDSSVCLISDENGVILSSSHDLYSGRMLPDMAREINENMVSFEGESCMSRSSEIENTGWIVTVLIPEKNLYQKGIRLEEIMLAVTTVTMLLAVVIFVRFASGLSSPLKAIRQAFSEVSAGKMDTRLSFKTQNEITAIADGFNNMVENVQQLNSRVIQAQQELYSKEIERARHELMNLQSQINSHFLYNTLNNICGMVQTDDKQNVLLSLDALINYLRYAVSNDVYVPLRDEIGYLNNYLYIQNIRFGHHFRLITDIPDSCLDATILKLLLQPLVENAIKHGWNKRAHRIIIKISVRQTRDTLLIRVLDNGNGMSGPVLRELMDHLTDENDNGTRSDTVSNSIGLINIHRRLRVSYGENAGMSIRSWEGKGTSVRLKIPLKTERAEDNV